MKQNALFKLSMFIIVIWGIVFFLPILFGITIGILSVIIYLVTLLLPFAILLLPFAIIYQLHAVKLRPLGRRYKAQTVWQFQSLLLDENAK